MTVTNAGGVIVAAIPTSPRALAVDPRFRRPDLSPALWGPLVRRLGAQDAERLWADAETAGGLTAPKVVAA